MVVEPLTEKRGKDERKRQKKDRTNKQRREIEKKRKVNACVRCVSNKQELKRKTEEKEEEKEFIEPVCEKRQ